MLLSLGQTRDILLEVLDLEVLRFRMNKIKHHKNLFVFNNISSNLAFISRNILVLKKICLCGRILLLGVSEVYEREVRRAKNQIK